VERVSVLAPLEEFELEQLLIPTALSLQTERSALIEFQSVMKVWIHKQQIPTTRFRCWPKKDPTS
jgi:hypothetical protein